jgi:hypothetical protein
MVLLQDPPDVSPGIHRVALGEVSDGIFLAKEFPAVVNVGVLLILNFEQGAWGEFELEIMMTSYFGPLGPDVAIPDDSVDIVLAKSLPVARPDPSWATPRVIMVPLSMALEFEQEADVLLWAVLDGAIAAEHPLIVRDAGGLPAPEVG